MTTLGERLTAERDKKDEVAKCAADQACTRAQKYADKIRDAVITYVDTKVAAAKAAAKAYVDDQIAKLVAANNLNPPQ